MKKIALHTITFFSLLLFLSACGTSNNQQTNQSTDSTSTESTPTPPTANNTWTGTYTFGDQEGEDGGGYLAIKQLDAATIDFELDINLGAPNYHSGTATGKATIADNVATWTTTEFEGKCRITFTLKDQKIVVDQAEGTELDCGFGAGVSAFGTFDKENNKAIFQYKKEVNEAINFDKTGTYTLSTKAGDTHVLKVDQLSDKKLKVQYKVAIHKDASNVIYTEIPLIGNVATFKTSEFGGDCAITFTFQPDGFVNIKQEQGDEIACGFSEGVDANASLIKATDEATFD